MPYSFPNPIDDGGSLSKNGESSCDLTYKVPFADVPTIATEVLSGIAVHYMFPAFICQGMTYAKFSDVATAGQYDWAKITLTFGPPKNDDEDPENEEEVIYEVSLDISGESITLPKKAFKLDSSSGDPMPDKFPAPSKIIPQCDLKLTRKNQTSVDIDTAEDFVGKVNSGSFVVENKTWSAGQVLFLGISTTHERNSEGIKQFDVTYNFQTHAESWQKVWDAEGGAWRVLDPPRYQTADLDDLLGI